MTRQEASEKYGIPGNILDEYESWGLCPAVKGATGGWQYSRADLERLGLLLTLHEIGFGPGQAEAYMRLALEGDKTCAERLLMLNQQRQGTLEEIHAREKQLDKLDYLRHEIRLKQGKN